MASILFKWFFLSIFLVTGTSGTNHPIFVSVTEIEHNATEKTLEVSCKIFTDDFEKTLRAAYHTPVDLLKPSLKPAMDKLVNDYVQRHLKIAVDGKPVTLQYLGYEEIEEGIYSYFQADRVSAVKQISITNNILYEYKPEQLSLLHVTVNGNRKSTKLSNPDDQVSLQF